jgi:beta-mannosidase
MTQSERRVHAPDGEGAAPRVEQSSGSCRSRAGDGVYRALSEGWSAAAAPPGLDPTDPSLDELDWLAARVPGTAAGVLADAGLWRAGTPHDFDAEDWWFRTRFTVEPAAPSEQVVLRLDGLATVAEVYLNGERVLSSDSMFLAHQIDVGGRLRRENELRICCRALGPLLQPRRRPRARWRTRLVAEGNLRFFRTMLLGRAPGFAPGPAAVGIWRAPGIERHRELLVEQLSVMPRLDGSDGVLEIDCRLRMVAARHPSSATVELRRGSGVVASGAIELLDSGGTVTARGAITVADVERWWPHTHGEPALYQALLRCEGDSEPIEVELGRVGFRSLTAGPGPQHDVLVDGLDLHVNGVRVFARGALWTPLDAAGGAATEAELRAALQQVRDAGMNMLRIPGTAAYETTLFHDLCDELGLLVWQDFMFANLDYPIADEPFRASVELEVEQLLDRIVGRPSLAVLCGNSEIEQQVAMLGLDPSLGRGELFGELLPGLVRQRDQQAIYLPSAPCGGALPFRPGRGVANYYGVGGYRRGFEDVRRAEVRFAAECLAFANVPDEAAISALAPERPGDITVHHPLWKAGVPRDSGSGWDFDDVRDHYLALLHDVDPAELRRVDHERYLELSRAVSGEAMAAVFAEWRRAGSTCGGGLVLWLRDMLPGAGWGLIDSLGEPKVAYHHLRRALAPVSVWMVDEGLGGLVAHVANDGPHPLKASLRVAFYRDGEQRLHEAAVPIELPAHGAGEWDVETLLGHFVDASWAYRFGPPAQDLIVASLEQGSAQAPAPIAQAFHFPAGLPRRSESVESLGLEAIVELDPAGAPSLRVRSRRLAYGVRVHLPGLQPLDDAFSLEPDVERVIALRRRTDTVELAPGALTGLNVRGRAPIRLPPAAQ